MLDAARGYSNARIARRLCVTEDTVRTWRGRFARRREAGLVDLPRSGRPRRISEAERAEVVALACQLPAETQVPLARWSCPELAAELLSRGLVDAISASSVRRILAEHPIKPWRYQSWIFARGPGFAAKAKVILDLYEGFYQEEPLGPEDRIVSIDAKPSIQARARIHPTTPPAPGRIIRVEHEYERHGALALLPALDVQTGRIAAVLTPPTTGIAPFMELMGQVMAQDRYRTAKRVFVIVDNGSDHRGQASINRLRAAHPNRILIHTPTHASWLNQVEIFFSLVQRKVVSPCDFASLDVLADTLTAFVDRYNVTATPFKWKYTAADLERHLARLDDDTAPAVAGSVARLPVPPPDTNDHGSRVESEPSARALAQAA
ncbi:transposase [Frankia casuarinae]|uniref:IS630 family transposase n=2 Tax=Frankia TaxID=1854 RepID=Q2JBU4_FRACC|nr:IS630 family transposase [Frankia casuarinae]ABD11248.1 putative IS630 family transposase [Frankia casuarinae]EYT89759.1 transposase [Frankia casuarinae]